MDTVDIIDTVNTVNTVNAVNAVNAGSDVAVLSKISFVFLEKGYFLY